MFETAKNLKAPRGAKIKKQCKNCKKDFEARVADHKRGWANFCSKSCKASHQTRKTGIAGPNYRASGKTVTQMISGKFTKSKFSGQKRTLPAEITMDRYGERKLCFCGEEATRFVQSGFGENGWEGMCDQHFDDTHPFDGSNFDN